MDDFPGVQHPRGPQKSDFHRFSVGFGNFINCKFLIYTTKK